jgi:GNAT superfamily N-acetyltransferase
VVRVAVPDAGELPGLVANLTELYRVVYAEPPYEEGPEQVARLARSLPEDLRRDGFALVAAFDGTRLVGAAYGWPLPPGGWFGNAREAPPLRIGAAAKFAVMEWQLLPAYRGRGVGAELITRLLADRTEPWAILAADPRSAARQIYARAGWQPCGHTTLPWGPDMDVLALPLTPGATPRS